MAHCSSDPKLEVLPSPPFLLFSLAFMFPPACSLVFFNFEGLLVGCIICVWWQRGPLGCSDMDLDPVVHN